MARTMAAAALAGALVGLLIATLTLPAHGAEHSCPSGAPVDSCFYPPNRGVHLAGWIGAGLFVGLVLGRLGWAVWKSVSRARMEPDPTGAG